jgi:hypothetical protein
MTNADFTLTAWRCEVSDANNFINTFMGVARTGVPFVEAKGPQGPSERERARTSPKSLLSKSGRFNFSPRQVLPQNRRFL